MPRSGKFLSEFGNFSLKSGFLLDGSGFLGFGVREMKFDQPESISSGEDPLPTAEVVGSVDVKLDPVGFFRWVGSSDVWTSLTQLNKIHEHP